MSLHSLQHLGVTNLDFQMEWNIYKWRSDVLCIPSLKKIWEKQLLVVIAFVAFGSTVDISIQEHWPFACVTRATPVALYMTLGILANHHEDVWELYLLLVADSRGDH